MGRAARGHVPADGRPGPGTGYPGRGRGLLRARAPRRGRRAALDPVALVSALNQRAGRHGVGRADIVENRLVGMKSRGVYETPGGTVLVEAHHHLQTITLDRDTQHYKALVAPKYAELVYNGLWYSRCAARSTRSCPRRRRRSRGTVRVRLYKGSCTVVGRRGRSVPVQPRPGDLRPRRRVRSEGRGGLHPSLRPADQGLRRGEPRVDRGATPLPMAIRLRGDRGPVSRVIGVAEPRGTETTRRRRVCGADGFGGVSTRDRGVYDVTPVRPPPVPRRHPWQRRARDDARTVRDHRAGGCGADRSGPRRDPR